MRWWWKRKVNAVTEALLTGEPPLKLCVTCTHLGPRTSCLRMAQSLQDPVTGRRYKGGGPKLECEDQRRATSGQVTHSCGRDAIFWVQEPRWWKRTWRQLPDGAQVMLTAIAAVMGIAVAIVTFLIFVVGPPPS